MAHAEYVRSIMDPIVNKLINNNIISDDESFALAQKVSQIISENPDDSLEIIIYVLDNWDNIPEPTKVIWGELIESVGFYPYIEKLNISDKDFGFKLRMEHHHSSLLNLYLHEGQKELSDLIFSGENIVASAPTSFGKSLLIEEIVASKIFHNIVIIQPTLALLDETRQKLNKYKDSYKIIVQTNQTVSNDKGNIFLLTAERVLEYTDLPNIDFLILDEFYKLSSTRGDNRSNILNNAFLKVMKSKHCQFYLLGPNIDSVSDEFLKKYNAKFFKTRYTLVNTNVFDKYDHVKKSKTKVSEEDLFNILDNISEQTLIFCSSPSTARKLAFQYAKHKDCKNMPIRKIPLTDWIDNNIAWGWSLTKCLGYGIGVHDGSMPKHITTSTITYFNQHQLDFLFCTNTIIEGVNTSAKNVIYYDNKIGKRDVDYFDYANIKGRAGRLMEHYVGIIINLKKPPKKELVSVDIPIIDQNPIDSDVLVNLEEDQVKPINDNKERYANFKALDSELQSILKRNAVSIEGQLAILNQLEKDIYNPQKYKYIAWNQPDRYLHDNLKYIIDLCWENLSTKEERSSFGSRDNIRCKIVSICYGDTLGKIIENDINYQLKELAKSKDFAYTTIADIYKTYTGEAQSAIDKVIEKVFSFQKNWQQYRAPKWLNVVDSLQKYACKKHGKVSGDYSYVAEMVENSMISTAFRVLLEYGVPDNAVRVIQNVLRQQAKVSDDMPEEELFHLIKINKKILETMLGRYELDIIEKLI